MLERAPPIAFERGDSNRDGRVDLGDPVNTLQGIFRGTGNAFDVDCLDRVDSNDDGRADISDGVHSLVALFRGGPGIPPPNVGRPWQDPTMDLNVCFE